MTSIEESPVAEPTSSSQPPAAASSTTSWSLAIKTVGNPKKKPLFPSFSFKPPPDDPEGSSGEGLFRISVEPDDSLGKLSRLIERETGVERGRQRLIYRGRILNVEDDESGDEAEGGGGGDADNASGPAEKPPKRKRRIRDIEGLRDGHTIHLVPRPAAPAVEPAPAAATPLSTVAAARAGVETGTTTTTDSAATASAATATRAADSPFASILSAVGSTATAEGGTNVTSISGPEGMNLLAALLGLSSNAEESSGSTPSAWPTGFDDAPSATSAAAAEGSSAATSTSAARAALQREAETALSRFAALSAGRRQLRRSGASSARARAAAARLTEADARARDPGSVEPVRQGLMTLHTLLGNALPDARGRSEEAAASSEEGKVGEDDEEEKMGSVSEEEDPVLLSFSEPRPVPASYTIHQLHFNRQWYRGQWLDALDTVNQWLEATVVDIVLPSDILSSNSCALFDQGSGTHDISPAPRNNKKKTRRRTPDAVVSANDLEGRRRLLLEPRPVEEAERDRSASDGRSPLDEGYRQRDDNDGVQLLLIHYNGWPHRWDEWIRSDSERIRPFRTRTRHRTTSQLASPTPQNVFQAAPATHIMDEDDEVERASLLPELQRVLSSVNEVLSASIPSPQRSVPVDTSPFAPSTDTAHLPWRLPNHGIETNLSSPSHDSLDLGSISPRRSGLLTGLDSTQLRRLAPLIDRLGRTLTDAAPHIASLADSLPPPLAEITPSFSPFSMLGEEMTGQSMAARVREMNAWTSRMSSGLGDPLTPSRTNSREDDLNDPDLSDFINGMVNTTRGANRNERDSSRDPLVSGLLSNYLASQATGLGLGGSDNNNDADSTLGRLIRMNGATGGGRDGGGPGIDIHIHAVVTGPGMNNFNGLGGIGLGGATTTTATPLHSILRNVNSSTANRAMSTPRAVAETPRSEEDMDLFSELYSESPTPLNMHGSGTATPAEEEEEEEINDLNQVFEECMSIEEEDSCATNELDVTVSDLGAVVANGNAEDEASNSSRQDAHDVPKTVETNLNQNEDGETNNNNNNLCSRPSQDVASSLSNNSVGNVSNGSIHTISEIGSTSSSPTPQRESLSTQSSTSFTNRLYRRTFGRLSSNRRASHSP